MPLCQTNEKEIIAAQRIRRNVQDTIEALIELSILDLDAFERIVAMITDPTKHVTRKDPS